MTLRSGFDTRMDIDGRSENPNHPRQQNIGGKTLESPYQAPPGMNTSQYSTGFAMGTSLQIEVARSGLIHTAHVVDLSAQGLAFDVFLFALKPSVEPANQAAYDVSVADDALQYIGVIKFLGSDYTDAVSTKFADKFNIGHSYILPRLTGTGPHFIYAQFVARSAPTYAVATDLRIKLDILAD